MKLNNLNPLNKIPYFNKEGLRSLNPFTEFATNRNIAYWVKNNKILMLKRGLYTTADYYEKHSNQSGYLEFIAGILYHPSYLSCEYVLLKNNILTDVTYGYTSVTLKNTWKITNKAGNFSYKNIKPALFTGYKEENFAGLKYYIATKSKALYDYIFYRSSLIKGSLKNRNLVEELRLNLESFTTEEFTELKEYSELGPKKTKRIILNLIKHASTNI